MPAHFENGENVTVVKFRLAFTQCRNNLKTVGNLTVKDFDAEEVYICVPRTDQFCSKLSKNVLFSLFPSVHTMPFPKFAGYSFFFKIYRFQNLLAKNMQFSCEQEA